METTPLLVQYGTAQNIKFNLTNSQGTALVNGVTLVAADFTIQTDILVAASLANLPTVQTLGYEFSFTALELTGKQINVQAVEATGNNFTDDSWILFTTGHPLSQYPFINIDTGISEGLTTGTPDNLVIPTTIDTEPFPNAFAGRIATWQGVNGTYPQGRILSNTAGVNTTITLTATASAAVPSGVRIVIM